MVEIQETSDFQEDDHRASYILSVPGKSASESQTGPAQQPSSSNGRPTKKRKAATAPTPKKKALAAPSSLSSPSTTPAISFPALLGGKESPESVKRRRETFETVWPVLDERIHNVLRESNRATLDEVSSFICNAGSQDQAAGRIPSGFIITGPNMASQDLLFGQLAETLTKAGQARVVRLRSAGVPNLKAALKKIIREATTQMVSSDGGAEEDMEVSVGQDGRKYLDYDLEILRVALTAHDPSRRRVVVAFEDGEAFDGGLLTDLIALFHSWQSRIPFSVVFGIATSVGLFQARLLKSTARQLYGAKFDVVQAEAVLESVFKTAIAGKQAVMRIGPSLLQTLLKRQQDQVAGIQVFISALKYAYMCHFYANPLSVLLSEDEFAEGEKIQPELLEAVRTLGSFKAHVGAAVEARQLNHAQSLVEDDVYLLKQITSERQKRQDYLVQLLRSLHLMTATRLLPGRFTDLYNAALVDGIDLTIEGHPLVNAIRQLGADEIICLLSRLLEAIREGSPDLDLPGWEAEAEELATALSETRDEVESLQTRSRESGNVLKSKYTAQSKILRTTVVAQKVQLSHDSATLTEEDKAFTSAIDSLVELLSRHIQCSGPVDTLFLHEAWVYDSRSPYRDVFVPQPGATFARALSRPHDYLSCTCCAKANGTIAPTLPTTSILYHMQLETGALANVADLWQAYSSLVVSEEEGSEQGGMDERTALVEFYQALAELRLMGFVKQSKKKVDHVARLKWL